MISKEIKKIIELAKTKGYILSEDQAFNILICSIYCYNSLDYDKNWYEIYETNVTDGSSDGGIDFVYYDDDSGKVIIGQNKFSANVSSGDVIAELDKIDRTIGYFLSNSAQQFNQKTKKNVLNALDSLTEENEGNIEIVFSSLATFKKEHIITKSEENERYSELVILNTSDIEKLIKDIESSLPIVKEFKFDIDTGRNCLKYESSDYSGIVLNIGASSLKKAFHKFESEGLFNLNIRRYIKSQSVDDAIIRTIENEPEDFWFLNNGLTIACEDYRVDGNKVILYDFSIVNGGQTTTLIAKNLLSDEHDFSIMCKIVKSNEKLSRLETMEFFNRVAEATNSQKPIQPRDLKANAPEMIRLQRILSSKNIFLEIKRGVPAPRKFEGRKLKNEELAQLIFSFVVQKPGTSRSNKKSLFNVNANYKVVFKKNYSKDNDMLDFLVDVIDFRGRIERCIQDLKSSEERDLNPEQMNVLMNGRQALIGLTGLIYRIVNGDYNIRKDDVSALYEKFKYGAFISNYKEDNIDDKIKSLVIELTQFMTEEYTKEYNSGSVSSASNFFKTDGRYLEILVKRYCDSLKIREADKGLVDFYGGLFKRDKSNG